MLVLSHEISQDRRLKKCTMLNCFKDIVFIIMRVGKKAKWLATELNNNHECKKVRLRKYHFLIHRKHKIAVLRQKKKKRGYTQLYFYL